MPALTQTVVPFEVSAWQVPDEPVPFETAASQHFTEFALGTLWGRPWETVWFRLRALVPPDGGFGSGLEARIDLGFTGLRPGFQAEGLVWSPGGRIIKALEPLNNSVPIDAKPGETVEFFVEGAANPNFDPSDDASRFAPTLLGRKITAGMDPAYRFTRAEIVHRSVEVAELIADLDVLISLTRELPEQGTRRARIVDALARAAQAVDPDDVRGSALRAREQLATVLQAPASSSAHQVFAVGHAHIDSAWLWPVRETVRKCARTFSNVLDLMERDEDFIFAASSAQQYAWVKQHYPDLFERIRARVAEGRFVPVGGMWVESDTNLPSGESLVRQFVEGQKFFLEEFGIESHEVWLPDSFGYSAAMPQISRAAGMTSFLTQKPSWNETNRMPHHTFLWEGIDGTRIFTHFPPVDTYNATLSGAELAHAESNFSEKAQASASLVPFGFGNGGGGPTREMMAAARRLRSLEGSPQVRLATPAEFFEHAAHELPEPPVWVGELYLEFHRGTYTSQARTKRGNRTSERLLHEAELWSATASVRVGHPYPHEQLREAWRSVLLLQFHDILPGSSIGWVYDQAEAEYAALELALEQLIAEALDALAGQSSDVVQVNSTPFPMRGVAPHSIGRAEAPVAVSPQRDGELFILDNGSVRAAIDGTGAIVSFVDLRTGWDAVPAGATANRLQVHRDTPTQYDAWDVDRQYREHLSELVDPISVTLDTDVAPAIVVVHEFGASRVEQRITMDGDSSAVDISTSVDWRERQKMLKLAFPIDVHTAQAASEIQFGHVVRPTHENTSWDVSRFETPAHRWVHVTDGWRGAGVANDATHGHDVQRSSGDRGTVSTIRQTLLRAPLFPDPEADQGHHVFRSSFFIGDRSQAIATGYRLRGPLRSASGDPVPALVSHDSDSVVIETVKLADDRSGDVVIRLYESLGRRSRFDLSLGFDARFAHRVDLLERETENGSLDLRDRTIAVDMGSFELATIRIAI